MSVPLFIAGLVGNLMSTARDMHRNKLICEKELAEIDAKTKVCLKVIDSNNLKVEQAFKLEMELLTSVKSVQQEVSKLVDKVISCPVEVAHTYLGYFTELQKTLREILASPAKYFTNDNLIASGTRVPELCVDSKIGSYDTAQSSLFGQLLDNKSLGEKNNSEIKRIR